MRFLSVAEEELRSAARRKGTHRLRWGTAAGFILFLVWLGWAGDLYTRGNSGGEIFRISSILVFIYCLCVGVAGTADCISRERREGTLGLLFMTNLNSAEIVAGKLCSNGLALMYSLVGILPVMAILLLFGGVTFDIYWRTVLALTVTIFFSLSVGFVASTVCLRQFPAVSLATGMSILMGTAPSIAGEIMRMYKYPKSSTDTVAAFCPLHAIISADNSLRFGSYTQYWLSIGAVTGISFLLLLLVAWRTKYIWKDRPRRASVRGRLGIKSWTGERLNASSAALRQRLLDINPMFWLGGRKRVSAPVFMMLIITLVLITEWVAAPYFQGLFSRAGAIAPIIGRLFAWVWTALLIHALVLYYGATAASQQLAEDKQNGALELILSTPVTERTISRGLWLAYWRRMFFPVVAAVLAHLFLVWQCATAFIMEPPGFSRIPSGISPGGLIWRTLFDQPVNGLFMEWQLVFMARCIFLILLALAINWVMLGWVGRWLGLRMKHPGFAPMLALGLALVPPTIMFSLACYAADQWKLGRLPERKFLPMLMWTGFFIVVTNCAVLSYWAIARLSGLRALATGRSERTRPWWRPGFKPILRLARATAIFVGAMALIAGSFYVYQNWQSRHRWTTFKKLVAQRGESLDLAASIPGPVPDAQNFALSEGFKKYVSATGGLRPILATHLSSQAPAPFGSAGASGPTWMSKQVTDFQQELMWIQASYNRGAYTNRQSSATGVLAALKTVETNLTDIAPALQMQFFQATTNRNALVVNGNRYNYDALSALSELHFLYSLRANALLVLDRVPEAGDDLLASLRVAQLARQTPDSLTSQRVRLMLARSIQPLWEGLIEHRWTEAQLASFEQELAGFDLLADYTNNVQLVTLAYIERWQAYIPASDMTRNIQPGPRPRSVPGQIEWQPRTWWYDNAISLYEISRQVIGRVDVAGGRMGTANNWVDLGGLPLDGSTDNLFHQYVWMSSDFSMVGFAQNAVNQTVIASALERFRLENGKYPSQLDELKPKFITAIPRDTVTGRPMFYRLDQTNGFALRGVGPDGVLGQATPGADDWVWPTSVTVTNTNASGRRGSPR